MLYLCPDLPGCWSSNPSSAAGYVTMGNLSVPQFLHLKNGLTLVPTFRTPREWREQGPGRVGACLGAQLLADEAPPHPSALTLQGAWFLEWAARQIMRGLMPPCQNRLLLHILASSTCMSSSCSALASCPPWWVRPQPATLHRAPAATAWHPRGKARGRMVLLGFTFPSSYRDRKGQVSGGGDPGGGTVGRGPWGRGTPH